jgi:tRNA U34 2-thiouridine synthase MnmA/TrmU
MSKRYSSFFFSQKHTYILAYLKRANFSEQIFPLKNYKQICKKKVLSKIRNRHDLNKIANFFLYKICSEKLPLFKYPKI